MAKAFDDREREIIHKGLIERGRDLFSRYGLRKTSIKDLTEAVGIAQGSFYKFFNSKEELYFDILEIEEETIKQELMAIFFQRGISIKESFKRMIKHGLKMAMDNTLLKTLYLSDEYELLVRKLPQDKIDTHVQKDTETLLSLITQWQKKGIMIDENPDILLGLIRSIFLISLHKKEIGEKYYSKTLDLLIDLIADGLFNEKE